MPRATPDGMKVCSKCGENKEVGEFYRSSINKDNLTGACKVCHKARVSSYQKINSENRKAYAASWRAANREYQRAYYDKWYPANKAKVEAANAAWKVRNLEKVRGYKDSWRAANPEKVKAANTAWRRANPEAGKRQNTLRVAELRNCYIAGRLGIPTAQVPPELIELKRLQIQIKREIKQQEQVK